MAGSITRELEVLFTKLKTEGVSSLSNRQIVDGWLGLDQRASAADKWGRRVSDQRGKVG
jgi:hypothetical protein